MVNRSAYSNAKPRSSLNPQAGHWNRGGPLGVRGDLPYLDDAALARMRAWYGVGTPAKTAIIADTGDHAACRFLECFTANFENPNTRAT